MTLDATKSQRFHFVPGRRGAFGKEWQREQALQMEGLARRLPFDAVAVGETGQQRRKASDS